MQKRIGLFAIACLSFSLVSVPSANAAVSVLSAASTVSTAGQIDDKLDWGDSAAATTWNSAYGTSTWWGNVTNGSATSSAYVTCGPDRNACGSRTWYFRLRFNLPADFTSPSASITYIADNSGLIYLNGYTMAGSANTGNNNVSSTGTDSNASHFVAGINTIIFAITDVGAPGGFGYAATIQATTAGSLSLIAPLTVFPIATTAPLTFSGSAIYRSNYPLTVTPSTAGKVSFYVGGKVIPGCKNLYSSGAAIICNWKPANRNHLTLKSIFTPTDSNYLSVTATKSVLVGNRSGTR